MKEPRYKRLIALYDLPLVFGHEAVKECCKAFKIAFANLRKRNITHFKIRYKRTTSKTIVVQGNCFSKRKNGFCIRKLGEMRSSTPIVGSKESKLTVEGGRTYLYVPVQTPTFEVVGSRKECALDPGVRTFQTMYCTRGTKEYGKRVSDKIAKVHKKLKTLDSRKGTSNSRDRVRWYEKARNKVYATLKSSIKQLHWSTALHLVKQFDTIYIGSFCTNSKRCVSRKGKLAKVTRFATNALSHFTFLQRLRYKAEQYGKKVVVVDESYTSKTCGRCFELNDVGSSKIYNCSNCNLTIDRDVNGARNIMLRAKGLW
jgi:IS605 OrfB family transposase